jgi:hypothetical protein
MEFPNVFVLAYITIGYAVGIGTMLFGDQRWLIQSIGTFLIAHTITWSGYIHHELCHNSVFESAKWNIRFGYIVDWINGACYWTFHELKKQHISHHIYKVDYDLTSSYLKWVEQNKIARELLCACEFFYFPLNAYIIHWRSIFSPWWKEERKTKRTRTLIVILIRVAYFSSLFFVGGLPVILSYLMAYSISIQIIRFTDVYSHGYEVVPVGSATKNLSKQYDMLHTYSIVLEINKKSSKIVQYLTKFIHIALFLNFNFHNQHHYATQKKWFQLGSSFQSEDKTLVLKTIDDENNNFDEFVMNNQPEEEKAMEKTSQLDSLCGVPSKHFTIPMLVALRAFHRHRVTRLFSKPGKPIFDPITGKLSLDTCYGVIDAPLLALEV